MGRYPIILSVIFLSTIVSISGQDKKTYRGTWDGNSVVVSMLIDKSGKVSGFIYDSSGKGSTLAVIEGSNYADGKIKVKLAHRFEDFGTLVLTKALTDSKITWSDSSRTFVFSRTRETNGET